LFSNDKDAIILGDFNDELNDPPEENIFQIFLEDTTHFQCLTQSIIGDTTYIGAYGGFIDHIIISYDQGKWNQNGSSQVLRIDQEFPLYLDYISDHRPVLVQFFIF
jgi:hypothetical protein